MGLTEEQITSFVGVIDRISSHPISTFFFSDESDDSAGDDNGITSLTEAKERLQQNGYSTAEEFKRSVSAMWDATISEYGEDSLMASITNRMREIFDKMIAKAEMKKHDLWIQRYLKAQKQISKLFISQPQPHLSNFNLTSDFEMLVPERKVSRSWLTPDDVKLISESFKYVDDPVLLKRLIHILSENEPLIDFSEETINVNLSALSQKTIRLLKSFALEIREPPLKHSISTALDNSINM